MVNYCKYKYTCNTSIKYYNVKNLIYSKKDTIKTNPIIVKPLDLCIKLIKYIKYDIVNEITLDKHQNFKRIRSINYHEYPHI